MSPRTPLSQCLRSQLTSPASAPWAPCPLLWTAILSPSCSPSSPLLIPGQPARPTFSAHPGPRVYTFRLCGRAQRGVAPRADLSTAAGYGPPSNGSHSHPLGASVATAWRGGSLSHSSHTSHPSHPHGELPPSPPGTGLGIQRGAACGPAQEEGLWAPETADGLGPILSSPHLCLSSLPKQVPLSTISTRSGTIQGKGKAALIL